MFHQAIDVQDFKYNVQDFEKAPIPNGILMCSPDYFDIIDVKNAFMEGQSGQLNKTIAIEQWNRLHQIYLQLQASGYIDEISVIPGEPNLEDMVFCANQTFPYTMKNGAFVVVESKMRHTSRQREVPFFTKWFQEKGFQKISLEQTDLFEGMGDTIPHPGRRLLYGGYGHRSKPEAYDEIAAKLEVSILKLELPHPHFYHLDTCFIPLTDESVMLCKEAFTESGFDCIKQLFKRVYEIPEAVALQGFCLNAHVIHGKNGKKAAIIQSNNREANAVLSAEKFEVYECQTSEFMKSGGSVFCMKMQYPTT